MGFGILANAFSSGYARGNSIANADKDREENKKRQAVLDQRYQDGIDRQARNDLQAERRYRDTQAHTATREGVIDKRYSDSLGVAAAGRERQSARQDIADNRAGVTFDNQQADRNSKQDQERISNQLRVILKDGATTTDQAMTALMRSKGSSNDLMDKFGVSNVRFHPYAAKDAEGNDTQLFAVLGQKKGDKSGNEFLVGKDGIMESADGNYQGLTQGDLVALAAHHLDTSVENIYASVSTVMSEKQKAVGKMTDREKIKIEQSNKMDVQRLKNEGKLSKSVKLTKSNIEQSVAFLKHQDMPNGWEDAIKSSSPVVQDFAALKAQYLASNPQALPSEAGAIAWDEIKKSISPNDDIGFSRGDVYNPRGKVPADQLKKTVKDKSKHSALWGD